MKPENVKEYDLIRQEMISVKECMTKYIGFVLGGSGLAIYAILSMGHSSARFYEIAFTCFLLSVIMSFVLLILIYKFFSHNRFAGYCKLLNHEGYGSEGNDPITDRENLALFAWEICIERLRASDASPSVLLNFLKTVDIKNIDKEKLNYLLIKYTGRNPQKDRHKFLKGLKILFSAIFGKIETRSWGFPPMIIAMFFVIVIGFLVGGFYTITKISFMNSKALDTNMIFVLAGAVLVAQLIIWFRFIGKLYALMKGSATVDGFFLRFMPVRASFLNKHHITPEYFNVNEILEECFKEFEKEAGNESELGGGPYV